jgi:preprotein translocase subunit SecD
MLLAIGLASCTNHSTERKSPRENLWIRIVNNGCTTCKEVTFWHGGNGAPVYLATGGIVASAKDILYIQRNHGDTRYPIIVEFRPEAVDRIKRVTAENVGKQAAWIVDDRVLTMPAIVEPFSAGASIGGQSERESDQVFYKLTVGSANGLR